MNDYLINVKLGEVSAALEDMKRDITILKETVKPSDDLWDSSDLIRHWHISERTLATWRKNGSIGFVKLNGKVWYTRENREDFLNDNLIQSRKDEKS